MDGGGADTAGGGSAGAAGGGGGAGVVLENDVAATPAAGVGERDVAPGNGDVLLVLPRLEGRLRSNENKQRKKKTDFQILQTQSQTYFEMTELLGPR